jgi:7,8-dihydropterin-6-yl-methyl-4-(beta-D-ribofuranosyl)aminobenzene 5'-phosphate synthase
MHLFLPLALALSASPSFVLILYDNTAARADLQKDWGFAAQIVFRDHSLLFDSGTKPPVLAANMKALGVDPKAFELGVFSHPHQDHLGGLPAAAQLRPGLPVYFLDSFPAPLYQFAESLGVKPVRVTEGRELLPGVFTTGTVPGAPSEQALVIDTSTGLVVLTGCSHPGIVRMVEAARSLKPSAPVRLVAGGFHMTQDSESQIKSVIASLRRLGVQSILPSHCSGDLAIRLFREAFGDRFLTGGAGTRIPLD